MEDHSEKLWDYDAVEPGQSGPPTVVSITKEDISWYALATQNPSSQFKPNGTCQEWPSVAMPTMVLTYSPLLREEIAKANGFVALEWSRTARRQTPFAKCEIRWSRGVLAGDTITSTRRVLEKYVRRGSRFVTFRVEATNQNGDEVAQYDYTCIFDYDESRKDAPQETRETEASSPDTVRERYSWEAVRDVGDQLAPLNIQASRENINEKAAFRLAGKHDPNNLHTDEESACRRMLGGPVISGGAAMSYVDQMLMKSFTMGSFYGGRLLLRAIEPFRPGDTVTFQGELTSLSEITTTDAGGSQRLVECRIRGINQREDLVNLSEATLVLIGLAADK